MLSAAIICFTAFSLAASAADDATAPISEKTVIRAIFSDLAYNAPHLTIELDAARPSAAINNLVRVRCRATGV